MEYKGIKLTLDMETKEFESAINRVKNSTNAYEKDIKRLKDILKLDPSNLEAYTLLQDKLRAKIDETWEAQNFLKQALNTGLQTGEIQKYSQEWANLTLKITQLNSQYDKTKQELDGIENGFDGVKKSADDFSTSIESIGNSSLKVGDLIKANLISDAIKWGLREVAQLTKELARDYIDFMKQGVEYNASIETYTTSIKAMLNGDEEAANGVVQAMKAINKQSAFSNNALLESAQQLIASDISAEEATKSVVDLAKALAYAGKSDDELKRMAQNLNQIKNAGKATAQDLKQFAYAGVPIYKLLAEYSEKFANGVDSKNNPATYEDIIGALAKATEEGGKFFDAFTQQEGTYNYELNRLKSNWLDLSGVIAQDATQAIAKDFLPAINEAISSMKKGFEEGGWTGLFENLVQSVGKFADDLSKTYPELEPIITALKNFVENNKEPIENFLTNVSEFVKSEEFATLVITVSDILTDIIGIVDEVIEFMNNSGLLKATLDIINDVLGAIEATLSGIKKLIEWINDNGGFDLANEARQYNIENYGPSPLTGGFVHSGGFGALQSGGYGNSITLNASFVANGNLDESQARRFASLMAQQINEELGGQL